MMADPSAAAPFLTSPDFNKLQMSTTSLNDWLESTDFSGFLSQEVFSQAPESPENLFYTPSPEVLCNSDSAYSSDCSEQHSPFDQLYSDASHSGINSPIDETLFEPYNFTDPLLVPEIEKILAGNPYELEIPTSIVIDPVNTSSSKKRIREEPVVENSVTLSRDKLLVMTSKEIESYVEDLKSKRTLTASEEKDLKRQRRLVKNREYASQSRSRKKLAVEDLEKQLEVAKAEADQYKKHNQVLVEENRVLKRQLGSIADTIKKVQQNGGSSTNLSSSAGSVGVFDKFVKIGAGRPANAPIKGVSACLLAIFFMVFTFAAFWDNESNFSKENIVLHRQRALSSLDSDSSVWEAASGLLRESWQTSSSYLPTWESAYQLFVATYPFYPSSSSSSSSSSSTTGIDMSVIRPVTEKIVPLKTTTTTTPPVPHLPPSSLPSTNKTCNHTGH